jgi:sugar/nucleoside kinase (ribokinase family)
VAVGQFLNVGGGVVNVHPWIVGLGLPTELIGKLGSDSNCWTPICVPSPN